MLLTAIYYWFSSPTKQHASEVQTVCSGNDVLLSIDHYSEEPYISKGVLGLYRLSHKMSYKTLLAYLLPQ